MCHPWEPHAASFDIAHTTLGIQHTVGDRFHSSFFPFLNANSVVTVYLFLQLSNSEKLKFHCMLKVLDGFLQ
jgi:hypothetical protein